FGDHIISVPANTQHFEWIEPMRFNGLDFNVHIEAGIHLATSEVYAKFYSIDPSTGLPPGVDYGFLPPEDDSGRGMGHFSFVIRPLPSLPTGTEIRNIAYITFDFSETIATNQVKPHDPSAGTDPSLECLVTIDADLPYSQIETLETELLSPINLIISGDDIPGGSGLGSFDIYVSDNGSKFTLWRTTTNSTIEYSGEVDHSYAFYSVAKDNAGNYEEHPEIADAATTIVAKHILINSWNLMETVRVGRSTFDYTFSVILENTRDQDVSNVVMVVEQDENNVTLIDSDISISGISARSTITSSDTITVRVDHVVSTPIIKLSGRINFDSSTEPGQVLDFISLLIGTNREIGDFNGDGTVNMKDLEILVNDWLSGNSLADIAPPPAGDGIVNIMDFAVMADNWLITIDN
ncbi:MAG: dockerin type I repeat-containing protein, partial [Anaerohalosphaera sp.]|nr:dockerin type I repeat-containing protein [Anaerohalosphaera sp.]